MAALVLSVAAGCNGNWASVGGVVTLDGKPLGSGENMQVTLLFNPEAPTGAPAAAAVGPGGEYAVSTGGRGGLAPGAYVATISAMEVRFPNGPDAPPDRRLITPLAYTRAKQSSLRYEVQPGRNRIDINLSSDAAAAVDGPRP